VEGASRFSETAAAAAQPLNIRLLPLVHPKRPGSLTLPHPRAAVELAIIGVSSNQLGIEPTERNHLFAIFSSLTGDKPAAAIRVEELNLITIYGNFTLV